MRYVTDPGDVSPLLEKGLDQILYIVDLAFSEDSDQDKQRDMFVQSVKALNPALKVRLFDVQSKTVPGNGDFEVHKSPEEIREFLLACMS